MKITLESTEIENRGLNLESETEEEKGILLNIWLRKGRPVVLAKVDGMEAVRLTIAPVLDDET